MKNTLRFLRILVAIFALIIQVGETAAEATYNMPGKPIDPDYWLEDTKIDPVFYFVGRPNINRRNRCQPPVEIFSVYEFFDHFNELVEEGVLDELDVRIVLLKRECISNEEMPQILSHHDSKMPQERRLFVLDSLGISIPPNKKTFNDRLRKIREELAISYRKAGSRR